ncbi:HlyD family efflux transporter periplasmic adaptor subunit [Maribellus comscasis]|uniref:HlyD family efflux transporter periplasmic adaptor subunit n=1 Tax=Maribellus comscasis TaxID=2681766 RepID=A0A6I6JHC0_9BACT|nr:efflux RND transporter periplasmic adaptor subunit [Maribellus comscasis]QGY42265.1 HlyD family efflux transporter periplasmic adaptor subunit [Maribellus comscasis]
MNKKTIATILVVTAVLAFIIYTFIVVLKKEPVVLQGEVEAKQLKIASKVPGRILDIAIKKGQKVNKGDFIFSIDSPEINAKMAEATAARSAASAQSRKAQNGAQQEDITAAYSTYVKAEAAAQFAEKTYERIQNLFEEGVVPAQKRDETETKMKAARETANAAKAIWQKAEKGAREEDKDAAAALVKRADAAIEQVQAYLDETSVNAISGGEVSGVNVEQGELVPTGFPVVTLLDLEDIWLTFYIREDYLSQFNMGNTFKAKIPGLNNNEYEFEVSYISPTGDFARWNATKTSGDFDLKSFEIEARPVSKIDGLRPGMTAIVTLSE